MLTEIVYDKRQGC